LTGTGTLCLVFFQLSPAAHGALGSLLCGWWFLCCSAVFTGLEDACPVIAESSVLLRSCHWPCKRLPSNSRERCAAPQLSQSCECVVKALLKAQCFSAVVTVLWTGCPVIVESAVLLRSCHRPVNGLWKCYWGHFAAPQLSQTCETIALFKLRARWSGKHWSGGS
jgi:hypothetical protein